MKQKITLLALIAVMSTGIFANPIDSNVDGRVLNSFSAKSEGAKNVSWNKTDQYLRASFIKDEQAMSAFFATNGELIGLSKNILSNQLPISLNADLKKLINNNWISELFEFTDGQETSYFVTVENADQRICYKGSGSSDWTVYKRSKKN